MKNPKIIQFHHLTIRLRQSPFPGRTLEQAKAWMADRKNIVALRLDKDFCDSEIFKVRYSADYSNSTPEEIVGKLTIKLKFDTEEEVTSFLLKHGDRLRKEYYYTKDRGNWNSVHVI